MFLNGLFTKMLVAALFGIILSLWFTGLEKLSNEMKGLPKIGYDGFNEDTTLMILPETNPMNREGIQMLAIV